MRGLPLSPPATPEERCKTTVVSRTGPVRPTEILRVTDARHGLTDTRDGPVPDLRLAPAAVLEVQLQVGNQIVKLVLAGRELRRKLGLRFAAAALVHSFDED